MYWKPSYIILVLFVTIVNYIACKRIVESSTKTRKKFWLYSCLVTNLGLLFLFKYSLFIFKTLGLVIPINVSQDLPKSFNLLLPIGLSFYTLQTLSYTFDVYRNDFIPEKHFGKFALYVSFFPQLISGPIERASNLLVQINRYPKVETSIILVGLKRILWGLFKKVIIADKLALIVDPIFGSSHNHSGLILLMATYFFAFQIYCDFSGYCDIAIGTAQLFGFKLSENFQKPYLAKSVAEFWRRWHVTLSSWFKDYVYIPIGGNRVESYKWQRNVLIVFILSGLWHGAGWNFILWGLINGIFCIIGKATINARVQLYANLGLGKYKMFHNIVKIFLTFNLVSFGWIFFRAKDTIEAVYIIKKIITGIIYYVSNLFNQNIILFLKTTTNLNCEMFICVLLLIFLITIEKNNWIERHFYTDNPNIITIKELLLINTMVVLLLLLGDIGEHPFLYFQF